MYADRLQHIAQTRYATVEQDGTLTLLVEKRDPAQTLRVFAFAVSALSFALPLFANYEGRPVLPLLATSIAAGAPLLFLWISGQPVARDLEAPAHSSFRRVRRSLQIGRSQGDLGYRESPADIALVIDGKRIDVRDLRDVAVFVIVTEVRGKNGISRTTEFVPTMLFGNAAYELDRFTKPEDAQILADVVWSACTGRARAATLKECPPWNPYDEGKKRPLVHLAEAGLWVGGVLLAIGPMPRVFAVASMALAVAIHVAMTRSEGRRMGTMRTALLRGYLPMGAQGADESRRPGSTPLERPRQHAAPPAKNTPKKRDKRRRS